jgi:curved DNA-binding protein CbpA
MADPYEILGVKREATQAEIRKAYLRLAKKNHPDLQPWRQSRRGAVQGNFRRE